MFGRGFTKRNLWAIRQFYLTYPIHHALRDELTWTHYRLLLGVRDAKARSFYEIEVVNNSWSTRGSLQKKELEIEVKKETARIKLVLPKKEK